MAEFVTGGGSVASLDSVVQMDTQGSGGIGINVSGTWSGTLMAEATNDPNAAVWDQVAWVEPVNNLRDPTITFNGNFSVVVATYNYFRVRAHPWTSGTATILLYGIPAAFAFQGNYVGRFQDVHVRTTTGTDQITLTNDIGRGIAIFLNVSAVTGTIARPAVTVNAITVTGDVYSIGTFITAGNTAVEKRKFLWHPAASGGLWDDTIPCPLPRNVRVDIPWVLPGGASVTYNVDVAFML